MKPIHECTCPSCRVKGSNGMKTLHALMNQFFSRLEEEQKWDYLGLECFKRGLGSEHTLGAIFGCPEPVIREARNRLLNSLPVKGGEGGRKPGLTETGGVAPNIVFSFSQGELEAAYQAKISKSFPSWFLGGKMRMFWAFGYPPGRETK